MFHHVVAEDYAGRRSALTIRESKLGEIAAWLLSRGHESTTVKMLAECLKAGNTASMRRRFVFTFDDGAKDNFRRAYPVLKEMGCTGTFFVPTDYIGKTSEWRRRGRKAALGTAATEAKSAEFEIMSELEIVELSREGFEIGSHGCEHADLTSMSDDKLDAQMAGSKERLSSIIGEDVATFAYPYGLFDVRTMASARKTGYIAGCSTMRGAMQDSEHVFCLKRIMVTEATSSLRLRYFMSGLLDLEHRKEFAERRKDKG